MLQWGATTRAPTGIGGAFQNLYLPCSNPLSPTLPPLLPRGARERKFHPTGDRTRPRVPFSAPSRKTRTHGKVRNAKAPDARGASSKPEAGMFPKLIHPRWELDAGVIIHVILTVPAQSPEIFRAAVAN